jgi:ABC-type nitrate/sulfonate/bicarbonate transport system ATPase subunit
MSDFPSPRDPILVFDRLTVSYRNGARVPVLNEFSLKLKTGEFLAVVGPSGCGKSTLLYAAAGFIKPDDGSILLKGQLVTEPSLQIGFVSQRYALFPWLTVEDNIAFGLRSQEQGSPRIRQTVDDLLAVIGLRAQRVYYPEQLSGGMQQRVALARAMAPNPAVLLLDEPFSALDSHNRHKMRDLLLRLWTDRGTTILFVTHDIEEAILLADTVLMLEPNAEQAHTIGVPFPRPRLHSILREDAFLDLLNSISRQYGAFLETPPNVDPILY